MWHSWADPHCICSELGLYTHFRAKGGMEWGREGLNFLKFPSSSELNYKRVMEGGQSLTLQIKFWAVSMRKVFVFRFIYTEKTEKIEKSTRCLHKRNFFWAGEGGRRVLYQSPDFPFSQMAAALSGISLWNLSERYWSLEKPYKSSINHLLSGKRLIPL